MSEERRDAKPRIQVDSSAFDDEELIEIGSPSSTLGAKAHGVHQAGGVEVYDDEGSSAAANPAAAASQSFGQGSKPAGGPYIASGQQNAYEPGDEDPDYSIDDLQPMPLTQKVVLFVLIAALVAGAAWIFNYYFGFSG